MKNKYLFFLIVYLISFSSCLKDVLNPDDVFEGPSMFTIEFQSGSFTGKTYKLISNTLDHDHEFLITKSIQKILSKPLQDDVQKNLQTSSFINYAWQGDTIPGSYSAIFALDSSISKSGDLQLIFNNGDELITSIPKGSQVIIDAFGGPEGKIEGSLTFTSYLDFRMNGISNREMASVSINFKIKRGPNL